MDYLATTLTVSLVIIIIFLLNDVNSYSNNHYNGKYHNQNFSKYKNRQEQSMVSTSDSRSSSFISNGKNDNTVGMMPSVYNGDVYNNDTPVLVGIAGGSGSGKTFLTNSIINKLGSEYVTYIQHDSYYKDLTHIKDLEDRAKNNFDHPDSLDTELLKEHLVQLKNGKSVRVPEYCYKTHSRLNTFVEAHPRRIIIVDGILLFHDTELCDILDMKIFVDAEDDVRLIRRIKRDTTERARTVDSVLDQYSNTVKPMHIQYVDPSKRNADIIIPSGNGIKTIALEMCLSRLREIINYYQ